jgi:hypothetical protein
MKTRMIQNIPFIAVGALILTSVIYIMIFNTTQYLEVIFICYASSIIFRKKILQFFDKNKFILFLVAEVLLMALTASTCIAILLLENDRSPMMVIANVSVLLFEIGYSLHEYPYKSKVFN